MRKKLKYLSIVLLLFIIFVSSTYAFYVAVVDKNGDGGNASVTTKRLSMSFTDGPQIELDGILPGATIIKTFSVNNSSSGEMTYSISFEDVINELSRTDDLVYTLTSTNNGASINETSFPTSDEVIVTNQTIAANTTHEYTLTIQYKNLGVDQADDMGKVVSATIVVGQNEGTVALAPGLYDADGNLLASYDTLVSTYNFDPTANYTYSSADSPAKIINNNYPTATKMVFPETITRIGNYSFKSSNLSSVEFSNNLLSIGDFAFDSNYLTSIELPDTLTALGDMPFVNNNLLFVDIPDSVTSLGELAFLDMLLVNYRGDLIDPDNDDWGAYTLNPYVEGDFAYEDNTKTILAGYLGSSDDVIIPSGVTTIKDFVFNNSYSKIKSVYIPASVQVIMACVFYGSNLESVTFEDNSQLTTIGNSAFSYLKKLDSITIPNSVTSISSSSFTDLRYLYYEGIATSNNNWGAKCLNPYFDGDYAYSDNTKTVLIDYFGNDKNIVIPNTVTTISDKAFYKSDIESVTIPGSVKTIGNNAFYNCKSLDSIVLNEGLETIGISAFSATEITSVTIPETVSFIGERAFSSNTLTSAIFIDLDGWRANNQALVLTDPAVNANYFKSTYRAYNWTKS